MQPIVSPHCRIRHPEHLIIGEDSIIDDFCYFSTRVRIGRCSHIASGCSIAGGVARQFSLGDFSSLSSGVKVWCTSDDFVHDLVTITPPGVPEFKQHLIAGDVTLGHYTAVGSNAVIMPANEIPEGAVIGALSFVPARSALKPWAVYAGIPVKFVRPRNRDAVLAQARKLEAALATNTVAARD